MKPEKKRAKGEDDRMRRRAYVPEALVCKLEGKAPPEPEAATRKPSVVEPIQPRWDADRRELWFGSHLCVRYKRLPLNQGLVLDSFQEMDWPGRIDDPLPRGILKDTLDNIRKAMNDSPIAFSGDGTAKGIIWRQR